MLPDLRETTRIVNSNLMRLVDSDGEKNMELGSVVMVLDQHLTHNSVNTKVAVLKWIEHLLGKLPNSVNTSVKYVNEATALKHSLFLDFTPYGKVISGFIEQSIGSCRPSRDPNCSSVGSYC